MKKKVGNQLYKRLEELFSEALCEKVFPGAATAVDIVEKNHNSSNLYFFGKKGYTTDAEDGVNDKTIYDLASLTKPLATTLALMVLMDSGSLRLTDSLSSFYNGFKKKVFSDISIFHILSHSSGFPAYRPYFINYKAISNPESGEKLLYSILGTPLIYPPGSRSLYSDLGFILLGKIIEKASGERLDLLFEKEISGPLGLEKDLFFRPLPVSESDGEDISKYAPTEYCRWRGKLIRGQVHDEHCYLFGGISGHAGLFGTIKGVSCLCKAILRQWRGEKIFSNISVELMETFLRPVHPHSGWCLGFDTPSFPGSSAGQFISPGSVGHLGFTGTSFWLDKVRGLSIVLLTNRVHPSRYNKKIREFRPRFHDLVIQGVDEIRKAG
ncbi:MAG: serine hydrolase [Desulfobulbaceae bacterium]|nr:serine hydrolase [Desulfobulbaceae bacterium]